MEHCDALKAWLRFNSSPTDDYFDNSWTAVGTPSVSSNGAEYGNALQLDGISYLKNTSLISDGETFTVDFWLKCPSDLSSSANGYIFCLYNNTLSKIVAGAFYSNRYVRIFFNRENGQELRFYNLPVSDASSHITMVYNHGDTWRNTYVYIFINGVLGGYTQEDPRSQAQCDLVIGALYDGSRKANATTVIDEFRVYNGIAPWITTITSAPYLAGFTPPVSDEYSGIFFLFDVQRKIKNFTLAQYYKNPGRADLLTTSNGTTVTGLTKEQSITGVGFYQPEQTACFGLSATKEIWIRCDVYTTSNYVNNDRLRIYNIDSSNRACGWSTNPTITNSSMIFYNASSKNATNIGYLSKNKNRSILLHMKSDASDGLIEISLKELTTGSISTDIYTGNVNYGNDFANVYIQMDGVNIYVSNLIISDAELSFDDTFILPVFDAIRMPKIPATLWQYENAGTITDLINTNTAVQVNNLPQTQSKTGSAFYQTTENIALFDIATNTPEIWIKFDVYLQSYGWYVWDCTNYTVDGSNTGLMVFYQNSSETVVRVFKNNNNFDDVSIDCIDGQLRTFILHMKADSTDGIIEVYSDNVGLIYAYSGTVNSGTAFSKIDFISELDEKGVDLFSNVIISNNPLWFYDNVSADISVSFSADAQREILKSLLLSFDAERQIVGGSIQQNFYADVERILAIDTSLSADTERDICADLSVSFDAERLLQNAIAVVVYFDAQRNITDEEIWRYENVGLLDELSNPSALKRQYYDLPVSKSKTGVAFTQFRSNEGIFPIQSSNKIWIKFDVYRESGDALWFVGDRYSGRYSTSVNSDSWDKNDIDVWNTVGDGTVNIATLEDAAITDGLQSIIVHMEADNSDGIIEIYTDGDGLIYSFNGLVHVGMPFRALTLYSISGDTKEALFSNIVISNGRLDFSDDAHWPNIPVTLDLDAQREVGIIQNFSADTQIIFGNNFVIADFQADAERYLDAFNKNISETFAAERILNNVVEISIDAQRNIIRNIVVPVYVPPEYIPPSHEAPVFPRPVDNSVIQSCTISMQEQQLTDNISFVYAGNIGIMSAVNLTYMDYVINGRVEETVTKGILESCQLASDVDELLYQQLAYEIPSGDYEWSDEYNAMVLEYNNANPDKQAEKVPSASASTHIQTIANKLGKNVALHFADFISTMSTKVESGTTYASLISELFGWTSRIPQMMINVYMRGNTIYVVQRGYEPNTVTLDNANIANVTIKRKIMRTTWGSSPWSKEEVTPIYGSERSVDYVPYPPKDDDEGGDSGTTYNDEGLVEETVVEHGDEKVTTKYEYITLGSGQKFLHKEIQETVVRGEGIVDKVVTTHEPVSMGQTQVYSTDDDGVIGSVVTPSRFDDRITPWQQQSGGFGGGGDEYTLGISGLGVYDSDGNFHEFAYDSGGNRYIRKVSYSRTQTGNSSKTIFGIPLVDTSFPVDGNSKLEELTNAIAWLNRKTEESITFELYNYPHVIDFSDKIVVGGNTYYLRSNTATRTETIVNKQTLEIVRWY